MSDGDGPYFLYFLILLVMVGSSVAAMRIPMGKALKMAFAWVGIFSLCFILFAFRGEFAGFGTRLRAEATGASIDDGKEMRIPIGEDGHFYVDASVNGRPVRFMVDSGASTTTISTSDARNAGLEFGSRRAVVNTANGPTQVIQSYADRLEIGAINRTDFPVDISQQDDLNLLGMNFLSTLQSWRVEGTYLVLQP
jgi:aspartyl protease family protein